MSKTTDTKFRDGLFARTRQRAIDRLIQVHAEDYRRLYEEEKVKVFRDAGLTPPRSRGI